MADAPIMEDVPLVVDLDGTLVRGDVFIEDSFAHVGSDLRAILPAARAFRQGKAPLKRFMAGQPEFDAALLPYNPAVLALIDQAKAAGRRVYLATGSHVSRGEAVAEHLGLFDAVFCTSDTENLVSSRKAAKLVELFGRGGFDYVGNDWPDIAPWRDARRAYVVRPPARLTGRLRRMGIDYEVLTDQAPSRLKVWAKALRVHQYVKNGLIGVPLLTAQKFDAASFIHAGLAFVAFCLIASSVYLLNDLIDIPADRRHPTKRNRPIPAGYLAAKTAAVASVALLVTGFAIALAVRWQLLLVVGCYYAMTLSYSLVLKRKMLVDIVVLALLYTVRIVAGAVAIDVEVSNWLATFSVFFFTALALIKRYTELRTRIVKDLADATNRNYRKDDLPVIGALAAASGVNSVTVFALYIASPIVAAQYRHPVMLWAVVPLLLYLLGRMLIMSHRGDMDDDPIVFALRDRNWRRAMVLLAAIFLAAIW